MPASKSFSTASLRASETKLFVRPLKPNCPEAVESISRQMANPTESISDKRRFIAIPFYRSVSFSAPTTRTTSQLGHIKLTALQNVQFLFLFGRQHIQRPRYAL